MPYQNGTGPMGQGSMTGRGFGPCGRGLRKGYGRGFKIGFRRLASNAPIYEEQLELTKEQKIKILEEEKIEIEKELKELNKSK